MDRSDYEKWCASIRDGWEREEKRNQRIGKKMEAKIQRGEYKIEATKYVNGKLYRVVTKNG